MGSNSTQGTLMRSGELRERITSLFLLGTWLGIKICFDSCQELTQKASTMNRLQMGPCLLTIGKGWSFSARAKVASYSLRCSMGRTSIPQMRLTVARSRLLDGSGTALMVHTSLRFKRFPNWRPRASATLSSQGSLENFAFPLSLP